MAMLIAWQTVNAVRHPNSRQFSSRFLIVLPGITIRDRSRVLLPNDPERLCCTNLMRDSSCESSVVAVRHEQTHTLRLQDQELARQQ